MSIELIIAAIIAALPTISAIVGIVLAVAKNIKSGKDSGEQLLQAFKETKDEVVKTKEYESLKALYDSTLSQYQSLLRAHRELLTKIDRIARKEEDYEGKPVHEEK